MRPPPQVHTSPSSRCGTLRLSTAPANRRSLDIGAQYVRDVVTKFALTDDEIRG